VAWEAAGSPRPGIAGPTAAGMAASPVLLGPLAGGAVTQTLGFAWLVLVPAAAGGVVLAVIAHARRTPA
jgi:hypothetical protein